MTTHMYHNWGVLSSLSPWIGWLVLSVHRPSVLPFPLIIMATVEHAAAVAGGFFKVWRSLTRSDFWLGEKFDRPRAFIDLVSLANYQTGQIRRRGMTITVNRGQVGWSQDALAERWKWSKNKVRRFLDELKVDGRISIETALKNIAVSALITITNYDQYQGDGTVNETEDGTGIRSKEVKEKNTNPPRPYGGVSARDRIDFFEALWTVYPKKSGKDAALRNYRASVKTDKDMWLIDIALENYLDHIEREGTEQKYVKGAAAFFYRWRDWVPKGVADAE